MEVSQLGKKKFLYYFRKNQTKNRVNNAQREGLQPPQTPTTPPPLDPPLLGQYTNLH